MTRKRLTYDELLQQREEKLFIGRDDERKAFRRNFGLEVPEHLIFALHGLAGIGKSFLVERYQAIARENEALTALTNEAEETAIREQSILKAMARLAEQLAEADAPLEAFNEQYQKYRECIQEIETDPGAPPEVFESLARATVRLAIGVIKTTPVGPAVDEVLPKRAEDALVEWTGARAAYLAKKFKNKADLVALVKEPVKTLTPLFVKGLNEHADERPVVLCFDTWERTEAHLDEWLRDLLKRARLSTRVWLVIAGRNPPGAEWQPFHPLMTIFELQEFTEEETRDYVKQQGITEEARVEEILAFSGGVPVLVSTLASAKGGSATEAANSLVDRYLKWVDDKRQRKAALDCAPARRLDKDVVAAVMGGDDADKLFDWLAGMPFVQSRPGYWEYHPKVRKLMLKYARSRSLKDSKAVHGKLQTYYQSLLTEKGAEARYRDEMWRRHTLDALYHGLMQESAEAEREGLETFLLALRGYYPLAGEIVMTWQQAAEEQEATSQVTRWAGLLGAGWTAIEIQSGEAALPCCEALRERKDLSDAARSEVYFISGLTYAELQDYERAIEDFGRAIELNPEYATAYYNQGLAYHALQDYARAIGEFGRAIELNPEDAEAYCSRGLAYYKLQEYERAIEEYGRAIELNPEYAMAYNNRGVAYHALQDYARAIEDYGRAIELSPEYATAYYNTACAYALMGEAGEAYEWLEKAIGLDEKYRKLARDDKDFDGIREDERFKALVADGG